VQAQLLEAKPQDASSEAVIPTAGTALNTTARKPMRSIELTTEQQTLSAGNGNWNDTTMRGTYEVGQHVLQGELSAKNEFHKSGQFVGFADTVTIDPDWFYRVSAGAGNGAFYLPRVRVDAFLNRKWLEKRNLVTSLGYGFYRAPDSHTDHSISVGGTYYFELPWIIEAGIRFNRSNPGSINTHAQFVAVTYGHEKQDIFTVRYGWGREGYQAIAQDVTVVDFQSKETSIAWRHWLDNKLGLIAALEHYSNPYYRRNGASIGIFYQFQ